MKRKLLFLLLIPFLIAGCTQLIPMLEIYPGSVIGVIVEERGDFSVSWSVSGGQGDVFVDFGDGATDTVQDQGQIVLVEHSYVQVGTYTVAFKRGGLRKTAHVVVDGPDFDLYMPFWNSGAILESGEQMLFAPFPRGIGCDNGAPVGYAGVWPKNLDYYLVPDLDHDQRFDVDKLVEDYEIRVFLLYADGSQGFVYGKNTLPIQGQWVSLQTFRIFAGWKWQRPPIPIIVLPQACDPVDPWEPAPIPGDTSLAIMRIEARNRWGVLKAIQIDFHIASHCTETP